MTFTSSKPAQQQEHSCVTALVVNVGECGLASPGRWRQLSSMPHREVVGLGLGLYWAPPSQWPLMLGPLLAGTGRSLPMACSMAGLLNAA